MIKKINVAEFPDLVIAAKKDGILFSTSAIYYGYFDNEKIVGIGSVLSYKNKTKIKTLWVPLEERGRGIFKKIVCYLLKITKGKTLEANCTHMSIRHFLSLGFIKQETYKNGITRVSYENL